MKLFSLFIVVLVLSACAGSATHKVVSAYQSGDKNLSCEEITAEMVRAQVIIDGVTDDKSGISGADVVDGLLFFPFNMIAKSRNYKQAMDSADRRIERLEELRKEKGCVESNAEIEAKKEDLSAELKKLTDMYKAGDLTKDEFTRAKNKLLN